jgi:hypothetical protein
MSWFQSFEIRAGRRANRIEPTANVDLCVGFAAEMARSVGVRGFLIPAQDGELRVATLNYEPVQWVTSDRAANFTPEFLERGHHFLGVIASERLLLMLKSTV